jgi:phage/plasmid-associated DNA primase
VADDEIIVDLDQQIVEQEIGSVIAWMLEGAAYLARYSSVPETIDHRQQLEKWRNANNSALQFLTDGDACDLDPGAETSGGDLYHAYTKWAMDNGVKAFGRNGFYEAIDEGAGRLGVRRKDARLGVAFSGVAVIRT